jgi:hypothetical protein
MLSILPCYDEVSLLFNAELKNEEHRKKRLSKSAFPSVHVKYRLEYLQVNILSCPVPEVDFV